MPSDLKVICEELRQIGLHPATPVARLKLEDAVESKWDGGKVAAAKALSHWGDPQSVHTLKQVLVVVAAKPVRWSTTGAIAKLLAPHLQRSDLDWVINVFVHRCRADNRFALTSMFEAFAPDEVLGRLKAQALHGGKVERDVRAAIFRAEYRARTQGKSQRN